MTRRRNTRGKKGPAADINAVAARWLAAARKDFGTTTGREFDHFYCPFLYRDEPADLCLGHVINQAFTNSDRARALQRTDVDNFFGSRFESDFVLLDHRGRLKVEDTIHNPALARKLGTRFRAGQRDIEYYRPTGPVPPEHTPIEFKGATGKTVDLAMKISPTEVHAAIDAHWRVELAADIRLPMLVSLLKAAHLTLFKRMGYRYALSAGGHFLGSTILGAFVAANLHKPKQEVLAHAMEHFRPFASLVRPMIQWPQELRGTLTDGVAHVLPARGGFWAIMVFVRAGPTMHAVLIPVMEQLEPAVRFNDFLTNPSPRFDARVAKLLADRWEVSDTVHSMEWPEGRFEAPLDEPTSEER